MLLDAVGQRGVDKDFDHIVPIAQCVVRAAADQNTGLLVGNFPNGLELFQVQLHGQGLNGGGGGAQTCDQRVQQTVLRGFIVLFKDRLGKSAFLSGYDEELFVVPLNPQFFRQGFSNLTATAARILCRW